MGGGFGALPAWLGCGRSSPGINENFPTDLHVPLKKKIKKKKLRLSNQYEQESIVTFPNLHLSYVDVFLFVRLLTRLQHFLSLSCVPKQYCRVPKNGGRRSQPGSFLFFTTPANLVLIFQSVFESRRLACSAHTVCDDARRRSGVVSKSAMPPKTSSSQQTLFAYACGETVLNSFFQPGIVLLFRWNSSLAVLRQTVLRHPTVL